MSLKFSGHETILTRTFWPKKGYDFIESGGKYILPQNEISQYTMQGKGISTLNSSNAWR